MAPQPQRRGDPLQAPRRTDLRIGSHGVVARVVQEVRPLVDRIRTRFDDDVSSLRFPVRGHLDQLAAGTEHAQQFRLGDGRRAADHDQIDQIVGIGQRWAVPGLDRNRAIQAPLGEVLAGPGDQGRIGFQSVNRITLVGPQGGGQAAVAAAQVHHDTAMHAAKRQDLACGQ